MSCRKFFAGAGTLAFKKNRRLCQELKMPLPQEHVEKRF